MKTEAAIKQLERSERGQKTCKLLLDLLDSPTVKGLDGNNSMAVAYLVAAYMNGGCAEANGVIESLKAVVERNQWVSQ